MTMDSSLNVLLNGSIVYLSFSFFIGPPRNQASAPKLDLGQGRLPSTWAHELRAGLTNWGLSHKGHCRALRLLYLFSKLALESVGPLLQAKGGALFTRYLASIKLFNLCIFIFFHY